MRLDLGPILQVPGGRIPFSFTLDLSALDFYGEHPFRAPVTASGEVRNEAGALMLGARIEAELSLRCDRCTKPFVRRKTAEVTQLLAETLENEEENDILLLEDGTLDLGELVTTALILEMDTKNLCSEDCKGLCDRCGKDLNEGPCGCRKESDPRLAALAALLSDGD
ncbi:MAG TPA: DUF177 domain-containing protein [Oscillospiraceae bacterium]|mgnify:CR=1 FL=1|nr:DUF177 domain-containing protein [Oscillospiraceae bacterium]